MYGIYNHEDPNINRPLALVAMQWSEDASNGSTLYERIEQFRIHGVSKHFGLNLKDFLDLPTDVVDFVLEQSAKAQKEQGTIAQDILNDLNNTTK